MFFNIEFDDYIPARWLRFFQIKGLKIYKYYILKSILKLFLNSSLLI